MVSMADPVKPRTFTRRYECAVCGRNLTADPNVSYRSRKTGRRFCSPAIGHLKRRKV
jgi:hypothetical protein